MASEGESLNDLRLAISSKISELEALTRAAGDAVVSDHLKRISESENQLLSLHQALVRKLRTTSKSDASILERQTWFSNFVSHDQKRLTDSEAKDLASLTKHWALSTDEIKSVEACAKVWAKFPYLFCDGGAPDKDVIRRCYNDLERIEDHDPIRRKVLLVTLSRQVFERQSQILSTRKTRKRCRKSQDHDIRKCTFLNSALYDICSQLWNDPEDCQDKRKKTLGRYSLFGWKWDRLIHGELVLSLNKVAAKRFELRRWSLLEIEALNAYTETLPQFAIRETLRKAWVAILEYYEGKWNGNSTRHLKAGPSSEGAVISLLHVGSAVQQEPTSSDECQPLNTPTTSDHPISGPAFVRPDGTSQDPIQDRPEYDKPTIDSPSDRLGVNNERSRASTVDLLGSPQGNIAVPSSISSQTSDTTPSDPHSTPSLHDQFLDRELASNRGQPNEQGQRARADDDDDDDDDGEGAGLDSTKRRRMLLSHPRKDNIQRPPGVGSLLQITALAAPTPADGYSNPIAPSSYRSNSRSNTNKTPRSSGRHLPTNTNFWSVVDDSAIDEASPRNQSISILNTSNVPKGQSTMSQQHTQPLVQSTEQNESQTLYPARPSPHNVFTYHSSEQNNAQTISADRPYHGGQSNCLHGERAPSRADQNQSSLGNIYASTTSAAAQAQETDRIIQPLPSGMQAHILERPTASSVVGGVRGSYWDTLANNHPYQPWEPEPSHDQTSDWTQSLSLNPVNFLDYLPDATPTQSLLLDPVNFLDYLPNTAPAQSLLLDPVNFLDYLPNTAPAQSFGPNPANITINPSVAEAQQRVSRSV